MQLFVQVYRDILIHALENYHDVMYCLFALIIPVSRQVSTLNLILIVVFKIMLLRATVKYMVMNTRKVKICCVLFITVIPFISLINTTLHVDEQTRIPALFQER